MPNLHDIERRIKSVESTKQITHTMQMVAAAKIRHSTERVEAATPYGEAVKEMLANIARMGGTTAPLATAHDEVKKTLIVVIASDRGLAGGFNSSVLRRAEQIMKERKAEGKEIAGCIQNVMNKELQIERPREIKANDTYYILKRSEAPAVIVECGFLSNEREAALLITDTYQQKAAESICDGIQKYFAAKM